jgi:hypothetical protein
MNTEHHDQVRHTLRKAAILLSVLTGALIAGCSSGDGGPETPPPSQEPPPPAPAPPNPSGLDARPTNATCVAPQRATGSATIGVERAFPNIRFRNHAIEMLQAPGDSSRWFVAERFGFVQVFDNKEDVAATKVFIDIDARVDSTAPNAACSAWPFIPISRRPRVCT